MHLSTIATLAALAMPFTSAQLSSIPECAANVTESAITAAGCTDVDVHCFCTPAFMGSLQSHIARTCSVSDQQVTLGFAQNMCKSVGVNFELPPDMSVSVATTTATATTSLGPDISPGTTTVEDKIETMLDTASTSYAWTSTPSAKPLPLSNATSNGNSSNGTLTNGTLSPTSPSPTPSFTGTGSVGYAVQWLGAVVVGLVGVSVFL